jgi:hypothetical protein
VVIHRPSTKAWVVGVRSVMAAALEWMVCT